MPIPALQNEDSGKGASSTGLNLAMWLGRIVLAISVNVLVQPSIAILQRITRQQTHLLTTSRQWVLSEHMQIAPGIDAAQWENLDLNNPSEWENAIAIFEQRIKGRFTDTIEFLVADDQRRPAIERRWGFAILSLDCLLVETLEAFRRGLTDTRSKSKELCVQFLTERAAYKSFFSSPDIATRFYFEFRCGLAHNAQIFGDGRVWSIGPLLTISGTQITVNRTAFHQAFVAELEEYLAALRKGVDQELRVNFRTKMDFIAKGKF